MEGTIDALKGIEAQDEQPSANRSTNGGKRTDDFPNTPSAPTRMGTAPSHSRHLPHTCSPSRAGQVATTGWNATDPETVTHRKPGHGVEAISSTDHCRRMLPRAIISNCDLMVYPSYHRYPAGTLRSDRASEPVWLVRTKTGPDTISANIPTLRSGRCSSMSVIVSSLMFGLVVIKR
jgi:hypothetical protein